MGRLLSPKDDFLFLCIEFFVIFFRINAGSELQFELDFNQVREPIGRILILVVIPNKYWNGSLKELYADPL